MNWTEKEESMKTIHLTPDEYYSEHKRTFALGRAWQLRHLAKTYSRISAETGRRALVELAESMLDQAKRVAENAGFTLEDLDDLSPTPRPDDHAF